MIYNKRALQRARRLCQKWHQIQHQLLFEMDSDRKQFLIYQELVIERRFERLVKMMS